MQQTLAPKGPSTHAPRWLELLIDRVSVIGDVVEICYVVPTGPDGEREPFWRLRTDERGSDRALEACDRGRVAHAYG
ncbi:MAG: hypothetical protein ACRYG8_50465 [Janthinobacterium lividum]